MQQAWGCRNWHWSRTVATWAQGYIQSRPLLVLWALASQIPR